MFRKTILAAAVIAASTSASAATWQNTGVVASIHLDEGIEKAATTTGVPISGGLVRLGAEYALNDTVTFTLNQSKATNAAWPTSFESFRPAVDVSKLVDDATFAATDTTVIMDSTHLIKVGDQLTFPNTGNGGRFVTGVDTNIITFTPALTTAVSDNAVISFVDSKDMAFGLISSSATSATYRVSTLSAGGTTTVGALIPTPQVNVTGAGLISADAKISFSAVAAGTAFDALTTGLTVATSIPQFPVAVTKLDAVVDVEQSKLAFVGGTSTASSDVLKYDYTVKTGTNATAAVISASGILTYPTNTANAVAASTFSVVHKVDSDFNWMDTSAATAGVQTTQLTSTNTAALNAAGTTLTITDAAPLADNTLTITKNVAATVIPQSTYSGTSKLTYTSSGTVTTKTITYASLGAWTLNGASVTAYGVPMGSTVSRFLWVNNKGAIAAPMTATVTTAGTSYGPYALGTAASKSAMSMGTALDAALTAAGVTLAQNSRANIAFETPVKAGDITISAAYKHIADADRLTLETSDTIQDVISVNGTILPPSDCVEATAVMSGGLAGDITSGAAFTHLASLSVTGTTAFSGGNINIDDLDCAVGGGTVSTTTTSK